MASQNIHTRSIVCFVIFIYTIPIKTDKVERDLIKEISPYLNPSPQVWEATKCPDGKFHDCSQLCIISHTNLTSYECACAPGFKIDDGVKTKCSPVYAEGQFLLAKTKSSSYIIYLNLSSQGGTETKVATPIDIANGHTVSDFAYDPLNNRLYWYSGYDWELHGGKFEPESKKIRSDTVIRKLNDLTAVVPFIHLDSGTQNLYYLNQYQGIIGVIKVNNNHHKILINRGDTHIESMAISLKLGVLVWTEIDQSYSLQMYSAYINGTGIKRLISMTYYANAQLGIDEDNNNVYWMSYMTLYMMKLDGTEDKKRLRSEWSLNNVKALTLDQNKLYWSDLEGIATAPKSLDVEASHIKTTSTLERANILHVGLNLTATKTPGDNEKALASYLIPKTKCYTSGNNGGCQHFCFPGPSLEDRGCACSDGFTLDPSDGVSCITKKPWKGFIAVTDGQQQKIFLINLAHPTNFRSLPVDSSERPVAIRFDPLSRNLVWSDIGHNNFQYFNAKRFVYFNGTEEPKAEKDGTFDALDKKPPKTLRKQQFPNSLTDGLALEPIRRLLYYSDTGEKLIGVYDLDGRYNKYIITEGLSKPRSIALERVKGWMFWTDWGDESKIERATMAGSERTVILNRFISWPNGLVSDGERIYWIDAKLDHLAMCNFDGKEVKILVEMKMKHPFGLALTKNHFYWSDWSTNSVRRVARHNNDIKVGDIEDITPPTFSRLLDITAFESDDWDKNLDTILASSRNNDDPDKDPLADGCYLRGQLPNGVKSRVFGNGGCSQICFPMPQKQRVCGCRDGDKLNDDGITCMDPDGKPANGNFARRNPETYLVDNKNNPAYESDFIDHTAYPDSLLCSERDMEVQVNAFKLNCITDFNPDGSMTTPPSPTPDGIRKMQCNYQCLPGFQKTSGDEVRTCYVTSDGKEVKWTGANLVCQAITCESLETPHNSDRVSCNTTYGTQCTFACKEGSQYISGDPVRTCQINGKWSGTPLLCQTNECSYPDIKPEAHIKVLSCPAHPKRGDECHFECLSNYKRTHGSVVIKCDPKGLWSAPVLQCQEVNNQCPVPDYDGNNITNSSCLSPIRFGQNCTFECLASNKNVIYKPIEGTSFTSMCQNDGKWSNNILQCSADKMCSLPQLPILAQNVSCYDHSPNSKCHLKCVENMYRISGSENLICNKNGKWDHDPIVCSDCQPIKSLPKFLNVSCKVETSNVSKASDYLSKCTLSCRDDGWVSIVDQRSPELTLECSKSSHKHWAITSPANTANQTNYLDIIPYCGELVVPDTLTMKLLLAIKRELGDKPASDVTCASLLPEFFKWLTHQILSLDKTNQGRDCLHIGIDNLSRTDSYNILKNGCSIDEITLSCDPKFKDVKLFTSESKTELILLDLVITNNPKFSGNIKEASDFWNRSLFKVLKNMISDNYITTYSFTLDKSSETGDTFFINEPPSTDKNVNALNIKCPIATASISNEGICVKCPPGTTYDNKIDKCVLCPLGYYQDKGGQTSCNRCPLRLTTLKSGSYQAAQCVRTTKKKSNAVTAMFIIFLVLCLLAILGVGFYLYKNKRYPFNSTSKNLLPIPTIFRSHNPEPQEMTSVPYGSFDNPLAVA